MNTLEAMSVSALAQSLRMRVATDNDGIAAIAEAFAEAFGEPVTSTAPPGTLGYLVCKYAIRAEDLKLFDTLVDALASAAVIGLVPQATVVTAKVTIIVSV